MPAAISTLKDAHVHAAEAVAIQKEDLPSQRRLSEEKR
jgi:hypothetical protein